VLEVGVDGDRVVVAGHHGDGGTFGDRALPCQGRIDAFHAELDLDGEILQVSAIGGPGRDAARALALAPDGSAFVAGRFELAIEREGAVTTSRGSPTRWS